MQARRSSASQHWFPQWLSRRRAAMKKLELEYGHNKPIELNCGLLKGVVQQSEGV
jgi:hypothetical protein